jgi:hypothetical protein
LLFLLLLRTFYHDSWAASVVEKAEGQGLLEAGSCLISEKDGILENTAKTVIYSNTQTSGL